MPRGIYQDHATVTLGNNGNATADFTVKDASKTVTIEYVVVSSDMTNGQTGVTQLAPVPVAKVYVGTASIVPGSPEEFTPGSLHGGTKDGDLDTGVGKIIIDAYTDLHVQWTGGVPHSKCTALIYGSYETTA